MSDPASVGIPYATTPDQPVSAWSTAIHAALKPWADEHQGTWAWWKPGYLVLTVDKAGHRELEPIVLHTWDEELTVELRHWDTHFPDWNSPYSDDPAVFAAEAISVADNWLAGRFGLAVYFSGDEWRGSKTIHADEDIESRLIDIGGTTGLDQGRIELRWSDKSRLKHFTISNGHLVSQ